MNNLRYGGAGSSAPTTTTTTDSADPYAVRSITPNHHRNTNNASSASPETPSSTGLIRLSLKKPMGIVFEPMYDPHQPSIQRGVRICDLPRTGAAALSRKLQVGDELLQINETTVSRLTFDEIMDFIIEADPESVNLLFRRPRPETLQARQPPTLAAAAALKDPTSTAVKWVDDDGAAAADASGKKKKKATSPKRKKDKKTNTTSSATKPRVTSATKKTNSEDEDATLQSKSTVGEDSYVPKKARRKKSSRSRRNPYETESFLDMLIDTLCSDSNNVCRDTFRRADDDYLSDDESFGTEEDETYATYESLEDVRNKKKAVTTTTTRTTHRNQRNRTKTMAPWPR